MLRPDAELRTLIEATGLSYPRLAERFNCNPKTVMGWYTGNRPPAMPGLVKCALQLIVLEQRGVVTAKLVERWSVKYVLAHQWQKTGEIRFVSDISYDTIEEAQSQASTLNAVERGELRHPSVAHLHTRTENRDSGWRWIVQETADPLLIAQAADAAIGDKP